MKRNKLFAVYDKELDSLMKRLGILGDFKAGRLKCSFSGDVITAENLHSFFPDSGAVKACCTKLDCTLKLSARMEEISHG